MDEYRAGETSAVVLAVKCTALAVVLSVIGFYMPLISLVVFLLIPLPIAYLGMKEGDSWSIIVTAGIMILDSVFSGSFPPLSFAPSSACLAWYWGFVAEIRFLRRRHLPRERSWCLLLG